MYIISYEIILLLINDKLFIHNNLKFLEHFYIFNEILINIKQINFTIYVSKVFFFSEISKSLINLNGKL